MDTMKSPGMVPDGQRGKITWLEAVRIPSGESYISVIKRLALIMRVRYEAVCTFLERNGLLGIIRGHEAQDAGFGHCHLFLLR
jgi:hypothetical protein